MKILVVEDEKSLAESIVSYLDKEGFVSEYVVSYREAEEKIITYSYDCVIIDITLPDGNGLGLIKMLKEIHTTSGIIIISAKNSIDDKIKGLEIGSDDYLTKPFHLSELNARIRSIFRRKNFSGFNEIIIDNLKIDLYHSEVFLNKKLLLLTKKEYDLLIFFASNKNRVLTKESIAEHLWGDIVNNADSFDFIYTHIKNLRKKIIDAGGKDYIKTVYAMGYKFEV